MPVAVDADSGSDVEALMACRSFSKAAAALRRSALASSYRVGATKPAQAVMGELCAVEDILLLAHTMPIMSIHAVSVTACTAWAARHDMNNCCLWTHLTQSM